MDAQQLEIYALQRVTHYVISSQGVAQRYHRTFLGVHTYWVWTDDNGKLLYIFGKVRLHQRIPPCLCMIQLNQRIPLQLIRQQQVMMLLVYAIQPLIRVAPYSVLHLHSVVQEQLH